MSHLIHCVKAGIGYGLLALALGTCNSIKATDAFTALQIAQVQVLTGTDCSVPGTATSLHRSKGFMDLALPDSPPVYRPYVLPVLVTNNLSSAGASKAEEMNNITLSHFTVELSAPNVSWSSSCPSTFDSDAMSDLLTPGGASGETVEIIKPAHAQCLQGQVPTQNLTVTAKITAKGRHGGTTISSAPFVFTIEVCLGCLQTEYQVAALIPYSYPAKTPMCSALTGSNPYTGDACSPPGQDKTIFCCGVTKTLQGSDGGSVSADMIVCPGVFTGTATGDAGTTP